MIALDYKYKARNADGKTIKGTHSGQSQFHVVQWLRDQNLVPISVTESRGGARVSILDRIRLHLGVSLKDKADVNRLVDAENKNRMALYTEIMKANKLGGDSLPKIQKLFANSWRDKSQPGWWIQNEQGGWEKKK